MKSSSSEIAHIEKVSSLLFQASKSVRILTEVSWPNSVKTDFFANNEAKIPQVAYPAFNPTESLQLIEQAKGLLGNNAIDDWMSGKLRTLEKSVELLCARGTPQFYHLSAELYGTPKSTLIDEGVSPLDLATQFSEIMDSLSHIDMGSPPEACILAETVASEMKRAMDKIFGQKAPPVSVVEDLSANALAGPQRVRIRKGACFTDKDVGQLIHHEAFVHVATSLNGLEQPTLKLLAINSPASTKTQEGLAVFAELISGSIDIDRMRRLADRVIAIQMSIDGADFMEVYRYFKQQTGNPDQSFENARRVFRGGVISGGAPFTKDVVYLDGLIRVHDFLKSLVSNGRADCLRLLFCGKLDIEDIPMLGWMVSCGICKPATFLPPWASDLRFLVSYLSFSAFSNSVNFTELKNHYGKMLQDVPKI